MISTNYINFGCSKKLLNFSILKCTVLTFHFFKINVMFNLEFTFSFPLFGIMLLKDQKTGYVNIGHSR